MKFRVSEKYKLELHWNKVIYEQDGIAQLKNCYFIGPVLKEVDQMNESDSMPLDFGKQYILVVPHYYIANLSWNGIHQTTERIDLKNVILSNKYVNSVPKLNDNDYILIDTSNHTDEKHHFYLTYPSYLLKTDGELYSFGR